MAYSRVRSSRFAEIPKRVAPKRLDCLFLIMAPAMY